MARSVFPTSADDVFANNRTIYIDQNIDVLSLNTTAGAGGVAGGRFYVNQGNWNINAANTIQAGTTYCVTVTGTGTRTLSSNFFRASDSTATTAAVLIQGTLGLPNIITYGNIVGGTRAGSSGTDTPAGITIEGGMLTHYGFISGGNVSNRNVGLKIYQAANSTIPVSAVVYGNVKGGQQGLCAGIICEYSPAANTLSACLISIYGDLSGGDSLLTSSTNNAGLYTTTTIRTLISGNLWGGSGYSYTNGAVAGAATTTLNLNIVGNIYNHPNFGFCPGLFWSSTGGNINLTGNIISLDVNNPVATNALGSFAVYQNGGTTFNVLGNVYGCTGTKNYGGIGLYLDATNTVNITGNVYGGTSGNAYGIYCADSPNTVNIYGNVYGSSAPESINGFGVYNNTTARINIFGSAIAGEGVGAHGVWNQSTGTIYAKRAVANSFGLGSAEKAYNIGYGVVGINISGINLVEEIVFGDRGQIPVYGPTYIVDTITNSVTGRKLGLSNDVTSLASTVLIDISAAETFLPVISDVENLTIFNNNSLTGTMIVPSASAVSYGTLVNNTTGSAYLAPSEFWDTQTTSLTALSTTIGYRVNNIATTEFVGNTLAAYNI